jgi:hypothetical protein
MIALASSTFGGAKAPLLSLISLALGFLASSYSGLNRNKLFGKTLFYANRL